VAFRENEAELRFRVPLHLFPFNTKYLNYEVFPAPDRLMGKSNGQRFAGYQRGKAP